MHNSCALKSERKVHYADPPRRLQKWRRKMQDLIMVSTKNPLCAKYFRSETFIRREKERHLNSKHPWVIHPLSKFRAWYEVLLVSIHLSSLISKPIDAGFARSQHPLYPGHRYLSVILDVFCWFDIYMNFTTGFFIKNSKKIEMDPRNIARNYMLGPFFVLDSLSSMPRNLPYFMAKNPPKFVLGIINIFLSLRFFRTLTLVSLIYRLTKYFEINRTKGLVLIFCSILVSLIVVHWLACLQHIVPRLTGRYFREKPVEESWIYQDGIYQLSLLKKYRHAFFKASSEILGGVNSMSLSIFIFQVIMEYFLDKSRMRLPFYRMTIIEDYIIAIVTYILGKILMITIWVILAAAILNARSMEIKFEAFIDQLTEYMKRKKMPFELASRFLQYYNFKYQKKYFKEEMISDLLSENLREEVNLHVCKSLISSVSIFGDLTPDQLSGVVAKLVPEIFLPNNTIIQSGNLSDSMYFLSSGTVAVYTHSGKEICHLQDGAYFGEISLVLEDQFTTCTIVAIEVTQVYRLRRRDFERTLMKNKLVYNTIIHQAQVNLKQVLLAEENHRRELFEKNLSGK